MKRFRFIFMSLVIFLLSFVSLGFPIRSINKEVELTINQKIPMRDGILLSANILKPTFATEPLPVILVLTPYLFDKEYQRGVFIAQHGYVYISVDCRGRGNSEGEFYPFENDGRDVNDIISWLVKQSWSNGQIAMRGGSYRGGIQWQALKESPNNLVSIAPTAAVFPGIDFPKANNIFSTYDARYLAYVDGKVLNEELFLDNEYWKKKDLKLYKNHLPFSKLDEITGISSKLFQRWLKHPSFDTFWQSMTLSSEDYKKINLPILSITGYFDGDQRGAMKYYCDFQKYASVEAKNKHYLIIGPWTHSGTRAPSKELANLTFGENSVLDMDQLHLEWFDWTLKGKDKPKFLKNKVCYYVMGDNKWKYSDKLENISNKKRIWYLSSENCDANDVFHSGKLIQTMPIIETPDSFEYDPLDVSPAETYKTIMGEEFPYPLLDQKNAFTGGKLIYHSPPFEKDLEISGYTKLNAYMSFNVPDIDFIVSLFEIKPNGKSVYLTRDMMRARYRKSLNKEELARPGEINLYEFKTFYFFSRVITRGSRLRLVISAINSPGMQKNYNSGGVVANETAKDSRKAIITLYHDKDHPSSLEVPIYKME